MKVLEKLGFWIIPLVALIIIAMVYWGPEGFYQDMKKLGETVSGYVPNVSIGMNELNASGVAIPANQLGEVSGLDRAIKDMLDSSNTNCFSTAWGGFKSDLGESDKSTVIRIYYDDNIQTMKMIITDKDGRIYQSLNFSGAHPCVIAGANIITKNFYNHYVSLSLEYAAVHGIGKLVIPYYNVVQGVEISYKSEWSSIDGNTITFAGGPKNGPINNFNNGGLLFKGTNNEICFFPTKWANGYDNDGIGADEIKELKKKATNICS